MNKAHEHLMPHIIEHKKNKTYEVGNQSPGLGHE